MLLAHAPVLARNSPPACPPISSRAWSSNANLLHITHGCSSFHVASIRDYSKTCMPLMSSPAWSLNLPRPRRSLQCHPSICTIIARSGQQQNVMKSRQIIVVAISAIAGWYSPMPPVDMSERMPQYANTPRYWPSASEWPDRNTPLLAFQ